MGILDSVKARFKNNDEEEFERAFREGRFPEGVDDFEPLSNTGNFIAPEELRAASAQTYGLQPFFGDDPYVLTSPVDPSQQMTPVSASTTGSFTPRAEQGEYTAPYAEPLVDVGEAATADLAQQRREPPMDQSSPAGARPAPMVEDPSEGLPGNMPVSQPAPAARNANPQGMPAQSPQNIPPFLPRQTPDRPAPQTGSQPPAAQPGEGGRPAAPMPGALDDGVQVIERQGDRPRGVTAPQPARPWRERLQDRVAQAKGGMPGLDNPPARQNPGQRPPMRRPAPNDQLEAELAERRRNRDLNRGDRDRARVDANARQAALESLGNDTRRPVGPNGMPVDEPNGMPVGPMGQRQPRPLALPTSPVVVRASAYDDVSRIASTIMRKHQPVVLVMKGSSPEMVRRVLDFSFGMCCGCGAKIEELQERVYVILPPGTMLGEHELDTLQRQGILR